MKERKNLRNNRLLFIETRSPDWCQDRALLPAEGVPVDHVGGGDGGETMAEAEAAFAANLWLLHEATEKPVSQEFWAAGVKTANDTDAGCAAAVEDVLGLAFVWKQGCYRYDCDQPQSPRSCWPVD